MSLSSASYGSVFQSDGENNKGTEDHIQDSLHVARCAGPSTGNLQTLCTIRCFACPEEFRIVFV